MKELKLKNNTIRLILSATPSIHYDSEGERLYINDNGTIYRYENVPVSAWYIVKNGDLDFLDQITEVMPYRIVPNLPKTKKLDTFILPRPSVVMWKVNSSNVKYVGYDRETQRLYVQFLNDEVYVYYDVEPQIFDAIRQADSKGSILHWLVKINDYRYEKIGGFLLDYSTNYLTPNSGTPHPDGYLVDRNWQ